MPTTITQRSKGRVTILDLRGHLTQREGVKELQDTIDHLMQQGTTRILANLLDVSYMDSDGLRAFFQAHATVKNGGGTLKLLNLTRRTGPDLRTLTSLSVLFDSYDDEEKAVSSFAS